MPSSSRLRLSPVTRQRILFFLMILLVAGSVRLLTFNFLRARLYDASWFQHGSYHIVHQRAVAILDETERVFWIDDSSRTDRMTFPPGYQWLVAVIYRLSSERSPYSVQIVQSVLDLIFSLVLITGVAVTAYSWNTGMAASIMVALSPLLTFVGVTPFADAPTAWFVIGGLWLLLVAAKRNSLRWALGAGIVLGVACWLRVNPLYLCVFLAFPLLLFARTTLRRRALMSAALTLGTAVMISPIVIRNYIIFDFPMTGAAIGANLWEGLGETELGRQHGFAFGDANMVERERIKMGLPPDYPIDAMWPDGIKRERERTREALAFIAEHPVWYTGVMLRRMWGMLKIFGAPLPYYGTSGINVTSSKTLPTKFQSGVIAMLVNGLGMLQSLSRYLILPLSAFGLWLGWRRDRLMTGLLGAVILYYLVPGTLGHPEIRYALPLHWLLPVFAGITLTTLGYLMSTSSSVRENT